MRRRAALLLAGGCLAAAGCGGASADLFSVTRSGTVAGANFAMVVRDDGTVTCNAARRKLPDDLLVRARRIQRDTTDAATKHVNLPSGAQPVFTYSVQSPSGRFSYSDDSPHQINAFQRLAQLTRQVARGVCGLAR